MQRILIILGLLLANLARADISLFEKVAVLRFGQEQLVQFHDGSLDLSGLGSQEYFHAQGDVSFVPGEFLDPVYLDESAFTQLMRERHALKVPLRLKTYPFPLDGTHQSFGTFVLRFHNDKFRRLAIAFPRLFHPMEIHFVDPSQRRRVLLHGTLNTDPRQNTNFSDVSITIPVIETDKDFYLYVKVTAPMVGGRSTINLSSFYIGDDHYVNQLVYDSRFYAVLLSGTFLIIFTFYSFIYSFRPKDYSSLYLCLYAFSCFALSIIYSVDFPLSNSEIIDLFTIIDVFAIAFLQCYLFDKLSFIWTRRTYIVLVSTAIFVAMITAVAVLKQMSLLIALCFMTAFLSSSVLILATIYLGIKHRLNGISFFLVGAIVNSAFQVPVMMSSMLDANSEVGFGILVANFGMALGLALVNAKEFAVTYHKSLEQGAALEEKNKEITFFNRNLEKLVDHKTKEVRSLLDYIPQGVLSLTENGVVSKDHSAHLTKILETADIDRQSFKTLILDRSKMSSDLRDQAWQAILASIGEPEVNFEVNVDKLPLELIYRIDQREKFLRATWNVEVEEGIVRRLLVTLLDSTAERELQKESEQQRIELILIQELINVPANKIAQFFSTSLPLLRENERIINADQNLSASSIRLLFVNAHTIKGAARTLQLRYLARQIHDMEEYYAHILKESENFHIERLKSDLMASIQLLGQYIDINRNKLNRGDDYSKVVIERDFIEKHYFFIRELIDDPPGMDNIIEWLREQNEALTKLIFEQLPASFDGYKERAIKIAKDLGKTEPTFDFNIDDVSIPPEQKSVLDNCMVHLLRNALDHGIETAAERRKKGKPEQGCIKVVTAIENNILTIRLSDDGRGLALRKLRAKGESLGLLKPSSTPQEIAESIFASGMSTAHEISEISGRGVGMNAVQSFMEKVGGSIRIQLGAPKDEAHDYVDFWFEIQFQLGQPSLARAS